MSTAITHALMPYAKAEVDEMIRRYEWVLEEIEASRLSQKMHLDHNAREIAQREDPEERRDLRKIRKGLKRMFARDNAEEELARNEAAKRVSQCMQSWSIVMQDSFMFPKGYGRKFK